MANKKTTTEGVKETAPSVKNNANIRRYQPTDMFYCKSVVYGGLILEGMKSGTTYRWSNSGDVTPVEFQDLQALQATKSRFLTEPWIIIEDDELVKYWGTLLTPIYSRIEKDNVEELIQLPAEQLKRRLSDAPEGIKKSLKSMAAAMIQNGELDSISRIKVIDEILSTDLMSYIQ